MDPYAKQLATWRSRRQQIKTMREQGKTLEQIGRKYGITRQRVAQILGVKHVSQ